MDPRYVNLEVYVIYLSPMLTGDVVVLCCDSVGEAKCTASVFESL